MSHQPCKSSAAYLMVVQLAGWLQHAYVCATATWMVRRRPSPRASAVHPQLPTHARPPASGTYLPRSQHQNHTPASSAAKTSAAVPSSTARAPERVSHLRVESRSEAGGRRSSIFCLGPANGATPINYLPIGKARLVSRRAVPGTPMGSFAARAHRFSARGQGLRRPISSGHGSS